MARKKGMNALCIAAIVVALALCFGLYFGDRLGLQSAARTMGYEQRLFTTDTVHTIDIVIDDWEGFLATATTEEYSLCDVVIDGEKVSGVGIRGKGNTSLSTVSSMDSDRYSFKIEFDQYDSSTTYHGLDKLSLNNLIQDTTYMKDYLVYRMMGEFGATAPLCSYVNLTVNGEPWGLYLAVEGVEDAFLQRNYGTNHGELYKPDSMNMGGGRGNGMNFDFESFMAEGDTAAETMARPQMPDMGERPEFDFGDDRGKGGGFSMGGGADLQYVDDSIDSYSTIFDSAKTDVTDGDKQRLIDSLRRLSEGDAESSVDIEAALRYFVVHNFAVNGDSYTGTMVHNYYLYEENGLLSMLPWDYNLAFGTFQGSSGSSAVNDDIDAPLSVRGDGSRPMADWIFQNEDYTARYHELFSRFLEEVDVLTIIDETAALIAPYVESDATAFYTLDEHTAGVATLREFCRLRMESVAQQLAGEEAAVDASQLDVSAMGTMSMGGGFDGGNRDFGDFGGFDAADMSEFTPPSLDSDTAAVLPDTTTPPTMGEMPQDMTPPEGFDPSAAGGQMPQRPNDNGGAMPQMPDNSGELAQQQPQMPDTGGELAQQQTASGKHTALLWLAVTAVVLAAGLLVALRYKP